MNAKPIEYAYIEDDNIVDIDYERVKKGLDFTIDALQICLLHKTSIVGENKQNLTVKFARTLELIETVLGNDYDSPIMDFGILLSPNDIANILMKRSVVSVTAKPDQLYSPKKKKALQALEKYVSNGSLSFFEFNILPEKQEGDSAEYLRSIFTKTNTSFADLITQERREES